MSASVRSVVVTGAGHGIGAAIAQRLQRESWTVVGIDIDPDALARQGYAATVVGDAGDLGILEAAAEKARGRAPLLGWVNNVATNAQFRLDEIPLAAIDSILHTSLLSAIYGCRVAIGEFLERESAGSIVNISSVHARAGFPSSPIYDAAKAGVEGLSRQLCVEYGHLGIRVNAVAPGFVLSHPERWDQERRERMLATWTNAAPRQVIMSPDEVAGPVSFLLSDDAVGVNGHVLAVDGGMAARVMRMEADPLRPARPPD